MSASKKYLLTLPAEQAELVERLAEISENSVPGIIRLFLKQAEPMMQEIVQVHEAIKRGQGNEALMPFLVGVGQVGAKVQMDLFDLLNDAQKSLEQSATIAEKAHGTDAKAAPKRKRAAGK